MRVVVCSFAETDRRWRDDLFARAQAAGALEGVEWLDEVCDQASGAIHDALPKQRVDVLHAILLVGRGFESMAQASGGVYEERARTWAPNVEVHRLATPDSIVPVVVKGFGGGWTDWAQAVNQVLDRLRASPPPLMSEAHLQAFTVFEDLRLELVPGLNVLIGPNASGKTQLLKAVYALLHAHGQGAGDAAKLTTKLNKELVDVFLPAEEDAGRLVRWGSANGAGLEIVLGGRSLAVELGRDGTVHNANSDPGMASSVLFIPARDVFAMFEGFIAAYHRSKISFDATYFELCVALSAPELRDGASPFLQACVRQIEEFLGGEVVLRGNRFYVTRRDGHEVEAHLLAEGHRKLASLAQLIRNGSITPGTLLFWDEPEANLNPKLIKPMADILRQLAAANVQILLATHDYLLSHELSMAAEYKTEPRVPMRFFSLYRAVEPDGPVLVESGDSLTDLDHNPILDEYSALYDRERALFVRGATDS